MSRPNTKRTLEPVRLKADVPLSSDGKAPARLRLLRSGVNETDRGGALAEIVFDEIAAAMVMEGFRTDGHQRLYADWNHGMLEDRPSREDAEAACSFVPVVENGELWADDIKWTDDGRESVESRKYNLFSPAFLPEVGSDGVCRPGRLINFALVNRAGLRNIPPLLAASAAKNKENATMDDTKLETELRARISTQDSRIAALESENANLRTAQTEVVSLRAATGLPATAPASEGVTAISGLVTLRGEVFKLSGKDNAVEAIAALTAMKARADRADVLEKEREEEKAVALRAELDAVFEQADKEKRVTPAQRPEIEKKLLALTGGKINADLIAAAKTMVGVIDPKVSNVGEGKTPPESGVVALTAAEKDLAKKHRVSEAAMLKAKQHLEDQRATRDAATT